MKNQVNFYIKTSFLLILLLGFAVSVEAQNKRSKKFIGESVKYSLLLDVLKSKKCKTNEIVEVIEESGVDFQLAAKEKNELKAVGASPDLINIISQNYRSPDAEADEKVNLGVVNSRATFLPKPKRPPQVSETGSVYVLVIITTEGKVFSAEAVSGPPSLRKTAEEAARIAEFMPITLKGKPVIGKGIILYLFL